MATVYDFLNPDSTEVEEQRIIRASGATTGDVLTVAANGTVSPAPGGGSQPVACVVAPQTLDASGSGGFWVWDTIYDNVYDGNQLEAFPDGMGLAALGMGTDTLTATEAGIWAFSVDRLTIPHDATFSGTVVFGNTPLTPIYSFGVEAVKDRDINPSGTFNFPSGGGFSIGVFPQDIATASPFNCGIAAMCIVRIG